jgi:acetyl-CoA acetyltransferase
VDNDVFVYDAVRTPFGKFSGALAVLDVPLIDQTRKASP